MKKVSLLALATALTAAQGASADLGATLTGTCPKAFQGFFVGGNIGYGTGTGKLRHFTDRTREGLVNEEGVSFDRSEVFGHDTRLGVNGVDGGINTGYTHRFGNWGLGLEFVANWTNTSGKHKQGEVVEVTSGVQTAEDVKYIQRRVKLRNSLQLRGNISYVMCNLWAPKVILGWDNSKWSQHASFGHVDQDENQDPFNYSYGRSKRLNGFLWGFGVDFLATKHVIVGFEYTGTTAGKQTIRQTRLIDGETVVRRGSWKPQYNKFALTAKVIY